MSTKDYVAGYQHCHPIVFNMHESLLRPTLQIMYLENYDYKKWGPVEYAKEGDACFDLRSCISEFISKDRIVQIPLGIKVAVPAPFVMKLYIRSGQAKNNGIMLANGTGIIDQGYRGEVCALIKNASKHKLIYISSGERIVQASLELSPQAIFKECEELPESSRGEGGFGHTGIS